jgi:hypothetical protein
MIQVGQEQRTVRSRGSVFRGRRLDAPELREVLGESVHELLEADLHPAGPW